MALYTNSEYKITNKGFNAARKICAPIKDIQSRKRAFKALICLDVLADYLVEQGYELDISKNLYKILPLNEEFEFTDLHYNGRFIDVLPVVSEKYVLIPKIHFTYGIIPDLYVVADYSHTKVRFLGCIEPSGINKSRQNNNYYIMDTTQLLPPNVLEEHLTSVKHSTITERTHELFSSYFIDYLDGVLDSGNKKRLITHLIECQACRDMLVEFFDYETITKNTAKYPEIFNDHTLDIVGAAAVNDEKYKNFEEITLEIDKEPDEYEDEDEDEEDNKIIRAAVDDPLQILYGKGKKRQMFDLLNEHPQKNSGKSMLTDVIKDVSKYSKLDTTSLVSSQKPQIESIKTSGTINPKYYEEDLSEGIENPQNNSPVEESTQANHETTLPEEASKSLHKQIQHFSASGKPVYLEDITSSVNMETTDVPKFQEELNPEQNTMSAEDEMILLDEVIEVDKPKFAAENIEDNSELHTEETVSIDYEDLDFNNDNLEIQNNDELTLNTNDEENNNQDDIVIYDEENNQNVKTEENNEYSDAVVDVEDKEEIILPENAFDEIKEEDLIHFNAEDIDLVDENDSEYIIADSSVSDTIPDNLDAAGIAGSSLLDYIEEDEIDKTNNVQSNFETVLQIDASDISDDVPNEINIIQDNQEDILINSTNDEEDILIIDEDEPLLSDSPAENNTNIIADTSEKEETHFISQDETDMLLDEALSIHSEQEEETAAEEYDENLIFSSEDMLINIDKSRSDGEERLETGDIDKNSSTLEYSAPIELNGFDDDNNDDIIIIDDEPRKEDNLEQTFIASSENEDDIILIDDEETASKTLTNLSPANNDIAAPSDEDDMIIIDDDDEAEASTVDVKEEISQNTESVLSLSDDDMIIIDDDEVPVDIEDNKSKSNETENNIPLDNTKDELYIDSEDIQNLEEENILPISNAAEDDLILDEQEDDSSFLQLTDESDDLILEHQDETNDQQQIIQTAAEEEDLLYYDGDEILPEQPVETPINQETTQAQKNDITDYDLDFIDNLAPSNNVEEQNQDINNAASEDFSISQDNPSVYTPDTPSSNELEEDDDIVIIDDADDNSFVRPASMQNDEFFRPAGAAYDINKSSEEDDDDIVIINEEQEQTEPVHNDNLSFNTENDNMYIPDEEEPAAQYNQTNYMQQNISEEIQNVQYDENGFEIIQNNANVEESVYTQEVNENVQEPFPDYDEQEAQSFQPESIPAEEPLITNDSLEDQEEAESYDNESEAYNGEEDEDYEEEYEEDEEDDEDSEEDNSAQKKNKMIKIAVGAVVLLILAGAGFGAKMLFTKNDTNAAQTEQTLADNQDIMNENSEDTGNGIVVPDDNNAELTETNPPVDEDNGGLEVPEGDGLTVAENSSNGQNSANNSPASDNSLPMPEARAKAGTPNATTGDMNKAVTNAFSDNPSAISIRKITWFVNASIAKDENLRHYLQSTGKNIQETMQNNIRELKGVNPEQKPKVQIKLAENGQVQDFVMLKSSGVEEIDSVVLQSVKDVVCAAPALTLSQEALKANEEATGGKTIILSLSVIF